MRIFILLLAVATPVYAIKVPPLKGRVNDTAGILSASERQKLEDKLTRHEQETSNQIVILTISTLGGESIEDVSIDVATKWKVGRAGRDNGILITYALKEDKSRIEIGYGLTSKMTAGQAGEILREHVKPNTTQRKYFQAFDGGTDQIFAAVKGAYKGDGKTSGKVSEAKATFFIILLIVLVVVSGLSSEGAGNDVAGGVVGAVGGFFLLWGFVSLAWGIAAIFIGFMVGAFSRSIVHGMSNSSSSSSDGWGSSGDSSPSFGGGGGDFGGDGASSD